LQQLLRILAVHGLAVALAVGAVGAAHVRAFVPLKAQPAQRFENLVLGILRGAGLVRVLDADDELPAMAARKGLVHQRHVGGADVRLAGGGWCDADADGHVTCWLPWRRVSSRFSRRWFCPRFSSPPSSPG